MNSNLFSEIPAYISNSASIWCDGANKSVCCIQENTKTNLPFTSSIIVCANLISFTAMHHLTNYVNNRIKFDPNTQALIFNNTFKEIIITGLLIGGSTLDLNGKLLSLWDLNNFQTTTFLITLSVSLIFLHLSLNSKSNNPRKPEKRYGSLDKKSFPIDQVISSGSVIVSPSDIIENGCRSPPELQKDGERSLIFDSPEDSL